MGEPQEIERGDNAMTLFRGLKVNELGLRRMNGQAKALETLGEYIHDPTGVTFQFETDNEVVTVSDQEASTLHSGLYVTNKPL